MFTRRASYSSLRRRAGTRAATLVFGVAAAMAMASSASARQAGAAAPKAAAPGRGATAEIEAQIANYAACLNAEPLDIALAGRVWSKTPDVTLIYPMGEVRGWEHIRRDFYEGIFEGRFSERRLTPQDIEVHAYGDSAWAEFSWHFAAKLRKDGSAVQTNGRETQIYRKAGPHRWVLVHVHYSALSPGEASAAPAKP